MWPKLFHNLRASRETELAKVYPVHLVCAWLGHAAAIAQKHYLQLTDEDFERAARTHSAPNSAKCSAAPRAHRTGTERRNPGKYRGFV
jgi:hypothetical protein